jgi:CRP/FNR family cyclic AMP-dependent transcriptional regulator
MAVKSNPRLIRRFTGTGGRGRLIEALKRQFLVAGDVEIARKLAKKVTPRQLRTGYCLISQGGADNDMYFILSGACAIDVNKREIAVRKSGEHVGEIALLDTTAVRTASVRITEPTVVAEISEPAFARIANKHPEMWRRMATALGTRLKERSKFHPAPRVEPVIFIGSSSGRGIKVAEHIGRYLSRRPFVSRLWSKGVFECSKTTIEDLMRLTGEVDFAVLVLTGDDVTSSRGKKKPSPRDNVIFELGLFMGALDRVRTYIVAPKSAALKIPTDLLGVTYLPFSNRRGRTLARNLQPGLKKLRALIEKNGPI